MLIIFFQEEPPSSGGFLLQCCFGFLNSAKVVHGQVIPSQGATAALKPAEPPGLFGTKGLDEFKDGGAGGGGGDGDKNWKGALAKFTVSGARLLLRS